jgi:hypothetical protein
MTDIGLRQLAHILRALPGRLLPNLWDFSYQYSNISNRHEFSRNLAIDKRDFAAIEFLLRKGRRQLEVYGSPGIKDIK